MFVVLVSVVTIMSATRVTFSAKSLQLKNHSLGEVQGCYIHNHTLSVCFQIRKGFMKLLKMNGDEILHYRQLTPKMILYQVLDQAFVWYDSSMTHVPNKVRRTPEALAALVRKKGTPVLQTVQNLYREAMCELHNVPEVQLLERLSAALADTSTQLETMKPFHALCLNVLKASDTEIQPEFKAAYDLNLDTTEKRSCARPTANNCRGMCGKGCSCWSWVCGDCCSHEGCYEHDLCCKENPTSPHCLFPYLYGFTCSRFGGYRDCLNWRWWG